MGNGYNRKLIDGLIRKHSLKINNKFKLVNTVKEDNRSIAIDYTNMTPLIIKNEFKERNTTVGLKKTSLTRKRSVFSIVCDECDRFYVGQTNRQSIERFKEQLPTSDISKRNLVLLII